MNLPPFALLAIGLVVIYLIAAVALDWRRNGPGYSGTVEWDVAEGRYVPRKPRR